MVTKSGAAMSAASSTDMIVIPQSIAGTVSEGFQQILQQLEIHEAIPTADLGSVTIRPVVGQTIQN